MPKARLPRKTNVSKKVVQPKSKRRVSPLRAAAREVQRRAVLDAAGLLLADGDLGALQMRALADAVESSTTVLYTLFGGRDAIVVALYDRALEALADRFASVVAPHPLFHLIGLAEAYRENARAHPYFVHITSHAPRAVKEHDARIRNTRPFVLLRAAVEEAIRVELLAPGDPTEIATVLWTVVHGAVVVEQAGFHTSREAADRGASLIAQAVLRGLANDSSTLPAPTSATRPAPDVRRLGP